jgi:hypothetical protein
MEMERYMSVELRIENYYELIALYRALILVKFPKEVIVPELLGSPLLANIFERLVDVLIEKEIEIGKPHRANNWRLELKPESGKWEEIKYLIVEGISLEKWLTYSRERKEDVARIYSTPFSIKRSEVINQLIDELDEYFFSQQEK